MNPSDNNSFGMQNAGGQGTMPAVQMSSADREDIVLPSSSKKGGKKWIFVVLGVVVVAALVALGVWMMTRGDEGEGTDFDIAYNEYANYVLFGQESNEQINIESIVSTTPYFEQSQEINMSVYLEKANTKYDTLIDSCNNDSCGYDLNGLPVFFQGYADVVILTNEEITKLYRDNGETAAREHVVSHYKTDYSDENMDGFLAAEVAIANLEIDTLVSLDVAGCSEDDVSENCDEIRNQNVVDMMDYDQEADIYSERMQVKAMNLLAEIYNDLYGGDNE